MPQTLEEQIETAGSAEIIAPETAVFVSAPRPYVDWSAVAAGAFISAASLLLLLHFGVALGLSVASPFDADYSATTVGISAAVYFALATVYSVSMGAYFTGRMRQRADDSLADEVSFRDGANGLVVWAVGLIMSAAIAAIGLAGAAGAAGSAIGSAASAATQEARVERMVDVILRPDYGADAQAAQTESRSSGAPAAGDPSVAGGETAGSPAPTRQPPPATSAQAPNPSASADENEAAFTDRDRAEFGRVIAAALRDGELDEADRSYLTRRIADETGLTQREVEGRIRETLAAARSAAEEAAGIAAFAAFWSVFVILLSGIAAWIAGSIGGSHRDEHAAPIAAE